MKNAFLFFFLLFSLSLSAQTVATKTGNKYTQTEVVKTAEQLAEGATKTADVFQDKDGKEFPVYVSKSGKLFYIATSKKTGNPYRRYFTEKQ